MKNIVRQTTPTRRNGKDDKPWSSLLIDIGDGNNDCYGDGSKQRISSCWPHIRVPEPFPRCRIAIGFIVSFAIPYQIASIMPNALQTYLLLEESESKQILRYYTALVFLQSIANTVAVWGLLLEKMRMAFCGMVIAGCCTCISLQIPICSVIQSASQGECSCSEAEAIIFVIMLLHAPLLFLFICFRRIGLLNDEKM